jgi:cysteine-rich repeat protein
VHRLREQGDAQVAKAEAKLIGSCMKLASKEADGSLFQPCVDADAKQRVAKARAKTQAVVLTKCSMTPDFGFTSADAANDAAQEQVLDLLYEIFGSDPGSAIIASSSDSTGAKCQQLVHKSYERVLQTEIATYNACKKAGLKAGSIDSQESLSNCTLAIDSDAKGKIAKAMAKLSATVTTACSGVNLSTAFPGECGPPPSAFVDCVEDNSRCSSCLVIRGADNTSTSCDDFDNGSSDGSCLAPAVCGNGQLESGEDCDDGNTTSGDCCSATCTVEPAAQSCASDGNACTDDECDGAGVCVHTANGDACDDSLFCNGTDTCASGTCSLHTGDPCPGADGDGNCSESCDETADACSGPDTNGAACDDGLFCNGTDTCGGGTCSVHTGDPCFAGDGDANCAESCDDTLDTCSAPDTDGSACDDSLFCNGADTCQGGTCSGHAGDPCPGPDADANCAESCDEAGDDCTATDTDGAACDDSLFCNGADTCASGACTTHAGDPCPGADGDGNCSETCDETADAAPPRTPTAARATTASSATARTRARAGRARRTPATRACR